MIRSLIVLVLFLGASPAFASAAGEDVFAAASHWTVQVRTAVDRPFVEDSQGSFMGAGLVIDARRGWVLTNAHVSSYSYSRMTVAFRGQHPVPAERVYVDPFLDLAIIAYDPRSLAVQPPEPALDCRAIPAVGHPVGAFGHPWGFRFTGTRGIASAVTFRLGAAMLQTDAPINNGNSGGPLISLETGRVVGINAATIRKDRAEGLNFAVPMPYACTIIALLRDGRDPSPPAALVDFAADANGDQLLLVARSRLPVDSVGLQAGDRLLAVGGDAVPLESKTDLFDALRGNLDHVVLKVERDGHPLTLRGSWPAAPRITERRALWIAGAMFADAEPLAAGHLAGGPRLMVHHIEPGSVAEGIGMRVLDLLVSVDGEAVDSLGSLARLADAAAREGRELDLLLLRLAPESEQKLLAYESRLLGVASVEEVGGPVPTSARSEFRPDRR